MRRDACNTLCNVHYWSLKLQQHEGDMLLCEIYTTARTCCDIQIISFRTHSCKKATRTKTLNEEIL